MEDARIVQKILVTILERFEEQSGSRVHYKLMRQEGLVEGVLQAKTHSNKFDKDKKKKEGPHKKSANTKFRSNTHKHTSCSYCKKTNHSQEKCWLKLDWKCHKSGRTQVKPQWCLG